MAIVALAAWLLRPAAEQASATPVATIRTVPVFRGPIEKVVRLSGTTTSVNLATVLTPRMRGVDQDQLILEKIGESGHLAAEGEVVATLEGEYLLTHIDDTRATLEQRLADFDKLKAQQMASLENMRQDVASAKAQVDRFQLDAGAAAIRTPIDQQILKLSLDEAQATYRQKQDELAFLLQSQAFDRRMQEYSIGSQERHLDRHLDDLASYSVRAPMKGMVVRHTYVRNGQMGTVSPGDEVRPGRPILRVMDTSEMQVEATINQTDSDMFRIGQQVRVGLDAFPDISFKGYVDSIGALAINAGGMAGNYVRQIPVRVRIQGNHPNLIPDLSAYADVVLAREDDDVQVPLAAVFQQDGESFVYVQNGQQYDRRPVKLGIANFTHAAVVEGLLPGEVVALDRPAT